MTGATGFIGRRLVARLCEDGVSVVALVRGSAEGLPREVRLVRGDITDPDALQGGGLGCDRLYHLAALVSFDGAREEELLHVNGQGTRNVLDMAKECGIEKTVVVSSACTLGLSRSPAQVLDEDAAEQLGGGSSCYMASKMAAEAAARSAARERDVVIVNPTTVYGPGDWSLNSGTLVSLIAHHRVVPVPPGGGNVVDVDDVVRGIVAAAEYGRSGRRYVLGADNLPFAAIFGVISRVVGCKPLFVRLPSWTCTPMACAAGIAGLISGNRFLTFDMMSSMFAYKYYSNSRAKRELHWEPEYSFSQSVERACAFYREHGLCHQRGRR